MATDPQKNPNDIDRTLLIDMSRFEPSDEEQRKGMVTKNACQCTICGSGADRYHWGFQCQKHSGHMGDPHMGMFSDLTYPEKEPA